MLGSSDFTTSVCDFRNLVFVILRRDSPIAHSPDLVGIGCDGIVIDSVPCFKHVNGIDISDIVGIGQINLMHNRNVE
jgi:hypothetical protein